VQENSFVFFLPGLIQNQTPSVQGGKALHRKEILDQMSGSISINLDDEESNQSTVMINPKPVSAVDSPTIHINTASDSNKDLAHLIDRSRSADSISQELNHFRPIRSCPLTPPRRLPSGQVVEPTVIRTTPKYLGKSALGSPLGHGESLSEIDAGSPIMRRRLSELAEERKDKVSTIT